MSQTLMMNLFGAVLVRPDHISESTNDASLADIMALCLDYRYAMTPELCAAVDKLTDGQRGTLFLELGVAFNMNIKGLGGQVSPLYRAFPNHDIRCYSYEMVVIEWLLHHLGFVRVEDAELYGADPFTGFQNDWLGANASFDAEHTVRFKDSGGNRRRKIRFLKLADEAFVADKVTAIMSNLNPLSSDERDFVGFALRNDYLPASALSSVKFREKLPLVWDMMSLDQYVAACNSVTDVLRLAVHLTGNVRRRKVGSSWTGTYGRTVTETPDLSLITPPYFKLSTGQAKHVMMILEGILVRGNTDHETDFLRHAEPWKRLASHIRVRQYTKRFPNAVNALIDLRTGWLKSWESKYAAADAAGKIELAKDRPGVFVRRLTELSRVSEPKDQKALLSAAKSAFESVDTGKLFQLRTHLHHTVDQTQRFHMLPNGTIMTSERAPDRVDQRLTHLLDASLNSRLAGALPFSRNVPDEAYGLFVPAGNRAASSADVRTSRGDRVKLAFEPEDTIRFFLHWHERCDVDMSAVFYDANLDHVSECTYYSLSVGDYAKHSGDILDGSRGAAEYIDIKVANARKRGIRYVLMNANVYSGMTFDTFPCHVGVMLRDGQTGDHFQVSTVESKLSLDSPTRNTTPAIFDLDTGEMIYVDLHGRWDRHHNVASKSASLQDALRYFVNYDQYRPSFGEIISVAGSDDPNAPVATAEAIRDQQDEILKTLAEA